MRTLCQRHLRRSRREALPGHRRAGLHRRAPAAEHQRVPRRSCPCGDRRPTGCPAGHAVRLHPGVGQEAVLHDQRPERGRPQRRQRPRLPRRHGHPAEADVPAVHPHPPLPRRGRRLHRGPPARKARQALRGLCPRWPAPLRPGRHLGRVDGHRHRRTRAVLRHHHDHRLRHPAGHRPPPFARAARPRRRAQVDRPGHPPRRRDRPAPAHPRRHAQRLPHRPGHQESPAQRHHPAAAHRRAHLPGVRLRTPPVAGDVRHGRIPGAQTPGPRIGERSRQPLLTPRHFPPPCS